MKNRDGRRLQQQTHITRQSPKVTSWPPPVGWDEPDKQLTGAASPIGARGTYKHLTDALLDVAATRQMYLRRLRTLADLFYTGGRLQQIVSELYDSIKDVAVRVRVLPERAVDLWVHGWGPLPTVFAPAASHHGGPAGAAGRQALGRQEHRAGL